MRVLFASTRGAGHFNPLVPFIEAARRGGHEVLVAGPPPLSEAVEGHGYPFWPGDVPPHDELDAVWGRVPSLSPNEANRVVIGEIFAGLNLRAMLPHLEAACREWRPDVVLRDLAEYASAVAAERRGVRHARVGVGLAATEELSLALAGENLEATEPGIVAKLRDSPFLTHFPPSLEDPEAPLPAAINHFRNPDGEPSTAPPPDWWDGERPLVYLSFGSVTGGLPFGLSVYRAALEAAAGVDARILVTVGRELDLDALGEHAPNVRVERWVPQAQVLGHAAAVVSHGGAGTTLGALAAGLPLVIAPLFADQPFNARRVAAVGAGVALDPPPAEGPPIPDVDPAELQAAIEEVLGDPAYAEAAGRIAAEMRALPPTDAALETLGQPERAAPNPNRITAT
jgi:UDP:flavonoid glycosyltransferase YjiC (YdhE family)